MQLLIFQTLGELLSKVWLHSIPGPVIGLVLLLAYFGLRSGIPDPIGSVGGSILQHLGLLFVPASVGVVLYLPLLQANAWGIASTLIVSVLATIGVSALVLKLTMSDSQSKS